MLILHKDAATIRIIRRPPQKKLEVPEALVSLESTGLSEKFYMSQICSTSESSRVERRC